MEHHSHLLHLNNIEDVSSVNNTRMTSLKSLVDGLKLGDRNAAFELVDIYYKRIYMLMRNLGHDRQISEDLTQETFLQAWKSINQLRNPDMLNSWIYRIASNISKVYWRKNKNTESIAPTDFDLSNCFSEASYDPEHIEQLSQLKACINKLPLKFKQSIVLHYLQCLTITEAAAALDIRTGTFKSRLNRALKNLKKSFESRNGQLL